MIESPNVQGTRPLGVPEPFTMCVFLSSRIKSKALGMTGGDMTCLWEAWAVNAKFQDEAPQKEPAAR